MFVAYTDGVSESRTPQMRSLASAAGDLIEQSATSAAQICARVLETIGEFRARQDQDDVTVFVVKALGLEALGS